MPSIETVSGRFVDPENPTPEDLIIDDMAWALSRTSRFAGHTITTVPYNNAQHSVFVADMIDKSEDFTSDLVMFGLLHDAAECYVGDLPSPIKRIVGLKEHFDRIENNLLNMIYEKYVGRLPSKEEWEVVKKYDARACQVEAYTFMNSRGLAKQWGARQNIGLIELQTFSQPESSITSYNKFINKFNELYV